MLYSTSLSIWAKPDDEADESIYKACGEAVAVLIVPIFKRMNGKLVHVINHANSMEACLYMTPSMKHVVKL